MICTKCGFENEDRRRFCRECGRKLQSGAPDWSEGSAPVQAGGPERAGGLFASLGRRPAGGGLGRYVEAWIYAFVLIALGFSLIRLDQAWLLYLLVPLAFFCLRLRGL
ncbi:MAG: zinc ribbon domain-containing protein [Desulfovibrionaceae bacterium]|nr:zinc ribbon domain-containing protein [Desulfovibrionaceae bacterium]MBF0515359.1 zinc ribbon domain-containing protein [Desulfovibrionaceae bacterium]